MASHASTQDHATTVTGNATDQQRDEAAAFVADFLAAHNAGRQMPRPEGPEGDDLASLFGDEVAQDGNAAADHGDAAVLPRNEDFPGNGNDLNAVQGGVEQPQLPENAPENAPEDTRNDIPTNTNFNKHDIADITSVTDDSANETPAKRGRGRPKGSKGPVRPHVKYRCRYGCDTDPMSGNDLRRHMGRIHGLFSSEVREVRICICGRRYNPDNNALRCTKRLKNLDLNACAFTPEEHAKFKVIAPRDAQESANTFAYVHGEDKRHPQRLVIVHDEDREEDYRKLNAKAIAQWVPENARATASAQDPAPAAIIKGNGRKRAAEEPAPAPAPKRASVEGAAVQQPLPNGFDAAQAAPVAPQFRQSMPEAEIVHPLPHPATANAAIGDFGLDNGVGNFDAYMQMTPQVTAPQVNAHAGGFIGMGFQQFAPGIAPPLQQAAPVNAAIGGVGNNNNFLGAVNFNFGMQVAPQPMATPANAYAGNFVGMRFQPLAPEMQQDLDYFSQDNAPVADAAFRDMIPMADMGEMAGYQLDDDFNLVPI